MEENKKDVLPLEGEPLTAPRISEPVVNALAAALSKIETYVPTQYIEDGPPDIDADHLNHAEQAIMRVTNLANGAADAIAALQSQVTQLNNNLHMTSESKRITVNGNQHNIKIDKIGNLLCVCNITLNTVTFNGSAFDVYTDPFDVSYRPKSTCVSPLSINGGEAMMEVMMLPDGRINLWNPNYKGNATMPMRGTLIWTV